MVQPVNVTISIKDLLRDLPINAVDVKTLIGKPIVKGNKPVGVIQSISEDDQYANGIMYLDVCTSLLEGTKKGEHLFSSIYFE